jgi:hypothetical protein
MRGADFSKGALPTPFSKNFAVAYCNGSSVVVNYNTIEVEQYISRTQLGDQTGDKAMNTFKKFTVAVSVGLFTVGLAGCGACANSDSVGKFAANVGAMTTQISAFSLEVGMLTAEIGAVTADIGRTIASDVLAQLRGRRSSGSSADVEATQYAEAAVFAGGVIETVVVEAPRIETVVVTAPRMETVVVEASRLPPEHETQVVRTAQARF